MYHAGYFFFLFFSVNPEERMLSHAWSWETGRSHGDDMQPVNYLSLLTFCAGTAPHAAVPCFPPARLHIANCQALVFQCKAQNLSVNTIRTGSLTEGA